MRRWKQDKFFYGDEPDCPHPRYGGCDGFGPDGTCAECTGLFGHDDGSVSDRNGKIHRRASLSIRLQRAWWALRQVPKAMQ